MTPEPVADFTVVAGGQGGDGSLTLTSLVGELFSARGHYLYHSRNVASRVKGGIASATLRASLAPRGGLADRVDLAIAFDRQVLQLVHSRLRAGACVIYDSSDGSPASESVPEGVTLIPVPLGRLAVRDLRRDLYKNSLAFAVAARLFGVDHAEAEAVLRGSLSGLPAPVVESNVAALRTGFEHAAAAAGTAPRWTIAAGPPRELVSMTGNEATAFGFMVAGGRFFAGYPITPASEILEWLSQHLPEVGGVAIQAEDELAAINLALGASMTGTRAMTASSGPGIALMQEGVGHLGAAEIGLVVVDCQRAGPSTGMPTKPEQSDVGMLVFGANGDIPRVVLAPGDPGDAFELAVLATNLAEVFQGPVYIALDQAVAQNQVTVDRFDLGAVAIDHGRRLGSPELAGLTAYRRYSLNGNGDGISPWVPAGTPGGQHLVTGNEHDEWGLVTTLPAVRVEMVDKRARKLAAIAARLPRARSFGDPGSHTALVGFGMAAGPVREAAERLHAEGVEVAGLQVRTLWPVLDDLKKALTQCRRIYVVEHNATGQYAQLLKSVGLGTAHVESVLRYDGLPFRPGELVAEVLSRETA